LAVTEPLKVADPVPTVKEFEPVIEVFPLRETLPVPVVKVPVPFWVKLPEAWVYPVTPVRAPPEVMARVGVLIKLVKPVADWKSMPLMTLLLLFVAAGKLIPFKVLVLLVFVALLRVRFSPLTVIGLAVVLLLVIPST